MKITLYSKTQLEKQSANSFIFLSSAKIFQELNLEILAILFESVGKCKRTVPLTHLSIIGYNLKSY